MRKTNIRTGIKSIIIIQIILFVLSCNNSNQEAKIAQLKKENLELKNEKSQNQETLYVFSETINQIQANLDTIKEKEHIINTIAQSDVEKQQNSKKQIIDDITIIYNKLIENRKSLQKLQRKTSNENQDNKNLRQIISRLNKQMNNKIIEIEHLRSQLENMQVEITNLKSLIDTLNNLSKQQKQIISYQTEELNTVYYTFGTSKELKNNGIISKKGGFLGFGRTKKLKGNLNKEYFTKINKYKLKIIPLHVRKARLITSHPDSSYTFIKHKQIDSLKILDTNKFWENSKYLVIETK